MFLMKNVHRLFSVFPPEQAHALALTCLKIAVAAGFRQQAVFAPRTVMGLSFPNAVGLAAGFDKHGQYVDALGALGFGFIEVGTVTPRPQPGNPRPRLFRLSKEKAIINRMGFNSCGMEAVAKRLAVRQYRGILGVNIGKNRDTPADRAAEDYCQCFMKLAPLADYVTVNVSSPNTPGLRDLQRPDTLSVLLSRLQEAQAAVRQKTGRHVPLTVKISPDLSAVALQGMAEVFVTRGVEGVIATNTTLSRAGVEQVREGQQAGGLSGLPLREKAREMVSRLAGLLAGKIPVIGCGGILSVRDAQDSVAAGASLIQLYSGMIYGGPALVTGIAEVL